MTSNVASSGRSDVHPWMRSESGIIDTCMLSAWKSDNEIQEWVPEPWRSKRKFPAMLRNMYPAPTGIAPYGEFLDGARGPDDSFPGSDPGKIISRMDADGASVAVLMPQTRGPQPDVDMGTVICERTAKEDRGCTDGA